jgi:hypothetical protein
MVRRDSISRSITPQAETIPLDDDTVTVDTDDAGAKYPMC